MYLGGIVEDPVLRLSYGGLLVAGVQHQARKVLSKTGLVDIERFLGAVAATVVNADTHRSGELHSETDSLDFCEGESSAEFVSVIVSDGMGSNKGSKFF